MFEQMIKRDLNIHCMDTASLLILQCYNVGDVFLRRVKWRLGPRSSLEVKDLLALFKDALFVVLFFVLHLSLVI